MAICVHKAPETVSGLEKAYRTLSLNETTADVSSQPTTALILKSFSMISSLDRDWAIIRILPLIDHLDYLKKLLVSSNENDTV